MAKSEVGVEMTVWWWMYVPELDSVVGSSPLLHCTGCVNVLVVVLLVYEL